MNQQPTNPYVSTPFTDDQVRHMLSALAGGASWNAAIGSYWKNVTGHERPTLPPPDGRLNWIWLTDLNKISQAIDIGSPFGEVSATLKLDAERVHYLGKEHMHSGVAVRRLAAYRDAFVHVGGKRPALQNADLAVFTALPGWHGRLPGWIRGAREISVETHALLRDGGWLGIVAPNPAFEMRSISRSRARTVLASVRFMRAVRAGIRAAGFSEVREYFAGPELDIPQFYVPRSADAVLAFHKLTHVSGMRDRIARLGVYAPLFPVTLLLARR